MRTNCLVISLSALFLFSCKPSNQYDTDNIYPIPAIPTSYSMIEIQENLKVQDNDIQPYVDEFVTHANDFGTSLLNKGLYYKLSDLSSDAGRVLGKCVAYKNDNILYIDQTFWSTASVWDKRSVIYHELGHCALGRGHRTLYYQGPNVFYDGGYKPAWPMVSRYLSDGTTLNPNNRSDWPLSLMHRSIVRQARFEPEFNYYLTELFTEDGANFVDNSFIDSYVVDDCTPHYGLDGNIHF